MGGKWGRHVNGDGGFLEIPRPHLHAVPIYMVVENCTIFPVENVDNW